MSRNTHAELNRPPLVDGHSPDPSNVPYLRSGECTDVDDSRLVVMGASLSVASQIGCCYCPSCWAAPVAVTDDGDNHIDGDVWGPSRSFSASAALVSQSFAASYWIRFARNSIMHCVTTASR